MILRLLVNVFLSILLLIVIPVVLAQEPALDTNPKIYDPPEVEENSKPEYSNPKKPTFQAHVVEAQYLPPALYGTWQVSGTLLSTNAPYRFKRKTSDIWILQQVEKKIRLANPDTQTETFITVNEVKDNMATFTVNTTPDRKFSQFEKITITVDGDNFSGVSVMEIQFFLKKTLIRVEQAFFNLNATKISGPTPSIFNTSPSKSNQ